MSKQKRSRGAPRPSFAPRTAKKLRARSRRTAAGGGTGSISIAPGSKESGRRNADRRVTFRPHLRMRSRALISLPSPACGGGLRRGALACRRSTAALAAANQRRRSAPARASGDAAAIRRYLKRACPSPASCSQTGHGAGRAFSRSRPGTAVTNRRPREPHSPQPPASPGGRPVVERDS